MSVSFTLKVFCILLMFVMYFHVVCMCNNMYEGGMLPHVSFMIVFIYLYTGT